MKYAIMLLLASLFWGLNYHLAQYMMQYCSAIEAGFWRYVLGVLPLGLIAWKQIPTFKKILPHTKGILITGIAGLLGFNFFFFLGLAHTSVMNGVLIMSLNPAITLLLAWPILGERISGTQLIGLFIALGGIMLLLSQGELHRLLDMRLSRGDSFFFLASLLFALQNVWSKQYAQRTGILPFTFFTNLLCMLGFVGLISFDGIDEVSTYPVMFWLAAVGMGVLGTALAYFYWNKGLAVIGAARGAIFLNTTPVFTALFAVFFGSEIFAYHILSGVVIVMGVVLVQVRRS